MATGPFDDARRDRIAGRQIFVVAHAVQVGFQEAREAVECFPFGSAKFAVRPLAAEVRDDRLGLAFEDAPQSLTHEGLGLVAGLRVEQVSRFPQSRQDVHQVQNVHGVFVAGQVVVTVGFQRALAVAEVDQLLPRLAAQREVVPQMLENFGLSADFRPRDLAREAGPVAFVLRFRRRELWPIRVAEQRRHQFLRRADVRIHRVHAAHTGHPLLVFLLAFGEMRSRRRSVHRPHHRDAFVVFGDDQKLPFRVGFGSRLLLAKCRGRFGHLPRAMFQGIHRLLDPQNAVERVADPAVSLLNPSN